MSPERRVELTHSMARTVVLAMASWATKNLVQAETTNVEFIQINIHALEAVIQSMRDTAPGELGVEVTEKPR